jgi:creatinine amidohydrolase
MEKQYLLSKMTWPEVEERLNECTTVVVPVGSTEQHGPALPVDNDHFVATQFAYRLAERVWQDIKLVVTPTIAFGQSQHHMGFKGTITLKESTLTSLIVDVCKSLTHHGFENIVVLNGHGGNETAIQNALHLLYDKIDAMVYSMNWWSQVMDKVPEIVEGPIFHACDMETSVSWYLGQRVLAEERVDEPGRKPVPGYIEPDMRKKAPIVSSAFSMKDFTDSGIVGLSTKATMEKGQEIAELALDRMADFISKIST